MEEKSKDYIVLVENPSLSSSLSSPSSYDAPQPKINNKLLVLFGFSCFAVVGNLYYIQPLLLDVGKQFNKSESEMGIIPTVTQVGYALGLFVITPLGDMFDRRKILLIVGTLVSMTLLINGFSVSYEMLGVVSFIMGLFTIMTQIIIPLSADLTEPKDQGKTIGFVMSGLLLGILLSRTISGWIGLWFGWRAIFWGGSIIMSITTFLLYLFLPPIPPSSNITYKELMFSLFSLLKTQPYLWQAGLIGATVFGSFSCFWTTITFKLGEKPYEYNSGIIGLFSLVGAAGVIGSPIGGYLVDKKGTKFTMGLALSTILIFMILLTFVSDYLAALIIFIFFYDVGIQTTQVCNQSLLYSLMPGSKSRINSVYMVIVYCGGAAGTSIGSWAYVSFPEKFCGKLPQKVTQNNSEKEDSLSSVDDFTSGVESEKENDSENERERETERKCLADISVSIQPDN